MSKAAKPLVAIVGRPNVGKSALFNRLTGQPSAIVEEMPGTTRDRLYADVEWAGRTFTLIDTGGLVATPEDSIASEVRKQAQIAIEEADLIVFTVDVGDGLTPSDQMVAHLLRRAGKRVLLVANKADNQRLRGEAVVFYRLGLGEPIPLSALHGLGAGDLLDEIVEALPLQGEMEKEEEAEAVGVAIVGRPNVGKSSLLNAILREERAIVHEAPGTTRDAIDTPVRWGERSVILIDTAGIRRRGRIERGLERYGVLRALRAIDRADVVLLVIDATEGVTRQDAHIAGRISEEGKGMVILLNKWDLIEEDGQVRQSYIDHVRQSLRFISYAPTLFVSALTGDGVDGLMEVALEVYEERRKRIPTAQVNRVLREALIRHAPPSKRGQRLRLYYASQVDVAPPTFVLFLNHPELVHFSYLRYLENQIRQHFPFKGTPLRIVLRGREKET